MIGIGFCNYRQDRGRAWSLNHLILKNTFRVILFEPFIAGIWSCKHLEMVAIVNLLFRVDVGPDGRHWTLCVPKTLSELMTRRNRLS
jgi:hypothetical protein